MSHRLKNRAQFIYTPIPSGNRRATGSHWRGHKLFANITISPGVTIYKATNHENLTYSALMKIDMPASRICRADGEVMDNKWFFTRFGEEYYVIDRDVEGVDLASAKIRKVTA